MTTLTNDIKGLKSPLLSGLNASNHQLVLMVVDVDGNPLENAHLTWAGKGTVTNYEGEAKITVSDPSTVVTISYMGKRSHVAAFEDLGTYITLQENPAGLPPVIVKPPSESDPLPVVVDNDKNKMLKLAAIGLAGLLAIGILFSSSKEKEKDKKKGLKCPAEVIL